MVTKKNRSFFNLKNTLQKFPKIMSLWRYSREFNLKNTLLWLENKNVGIFLNFISKTRQVLRFPKIMILAPKKVILAFFPFFLDLFSKTHNYDFKNLRFLRNFSFNLKNNTITPKNYEFVVFFSTFLGADFKICSYCFQKKLFWN